MFRQIKKFIRDQIKNIFGERVILFYHFCLAHVAGFYYGHPSKKMLVIAITGTKGKTSTLNFLWHVLTSAGYKVGLISTANIKIGSEEKMNWYHMTMPGRFLLQKFLWQMEKERCDIVLVEVTSEGIKMNRHVGLYYDIAIFTRIHPEHLKSHKNSFEEYRKTKGILFENLSKLPRKRWNGVDLDKVTILNADDENFNYFNNFSADIKFSFGEKNGDYKFSDVSVGVAGTSFTFEENKYEFPLLGKFNVYNVMPAILVSKYLQVEQDKVIEGVKSCTVIPGRMEIINEGQNFSAIVDYAYEPVSMKEAITAVKNLKKKEENKVVVVFGGDGGGREPRTEVVRVVSQMANIGIITLSDPFDTDPEIINNFLMSKALEFGMKKGENVFDYLDRREAIKKAVFIAEEGDVLLFCCKGSEQTIIFKDHVEPWDDREEVRKAIREKYAKK